MQQLRWCPQLMSATFFKPFLNANQIIFSLFPQSDTCIWLFFPHSPVIENPKLKRVNLPRNYWKGSPWTDPALSPTLFLTPEPEGNTCKILTFGNPAVLWKDLVKKMVYKCFWFYGMEWNLNRTSVWCKISWNTALMLTLRLNDL